MEEAWPFAKNRRSACVGRMIWRCFGKAQVPPVFSPKKLMFHFSRLKLAGLDPPFCLSIQIQSINAKSLRKTIYVALSFWVVFEKPVEVHDKLKKWSPAAPQASAWHCVATWSVPCITNTCNYNRNSPRMGVAVAIPSLICLAEDSCTKRVKSY